MNQAETNRFNKLYQRHLRLLKLQGKSKKTIDAYSRAVRRIREHFDCCPDQLTLEQREQFFSDLVESHSWTGALAGGASSRPIAASHCPCLRWPSLCPLMRAAMSTS